MKKEDLLINLSAHCDANSERENEIEKTLTDNLDWDYFLRVAKKEGVSSLVYKTFSRISKAEKTVPKDIFNNLKEIYYSTLGENITKWTELEALLDTFDSEGIKTIIFKGPALAEIVYKDIGLRLMDDVDILVKEKDMEKADELLKNLGYKSSSYIKDFSRISPNPYRNSIMYNKPNGKLRCIHLFWHMINLFPYNILVFKKIDMDKMWREAEVITLANAQTFKFSIYHEIIHLCMHAFTHSFAHLILLCDINELLKINEKAIDWQTLVKEANLFGLSKYLYYGLYVCKEILGTEIPDSIFEEIRPKKTSLFERKFIAAVLERKSISHSDILASFGMNETVYERIRYLNNLLFPPEDVLPLIRQVGPSKLSILDYSKRVKAGATTTFRVFKNVVFR